MNRHFSFRVHAQQDSKTLFSISVSKHLPPFSIVKRIKRRRFDFQINVIVPQCKTFWMYDQALAEICHKDLHEHLLQCWEFPFRQRVAAYNWFETKLFAHHLCESGVGKLFFAQPVNLEAITFSKKVYGTYKRNPGVLWFTLV